VTCDFFNDTSGRTAIVRPQNRVARWFIFVPKIPIWVYIFRRALEWKMLVHFMTFWNIWMPLDIFYGHLVYLVCVKCVYFIVLVRLNKEKSGNPAAEWLLILYTCFDDEITHFQLFCNVVFKEQTWITLVVLTKFEALILSRPSRNLSWYKTLPTFHYWNS
jgi:hypothetical protein